MIMENTVWLLNIFTWKLWSELNPFFFLGTEKAKDIALFFALDDENECMVDPKFWSKFQYFLSAYEKSDDSIENMFSR